MSTALEMLITRLAALPLDLQQQVADELRVQMKVLVPSPPMPSRRIPGLGRGTVRMAEGFDDPLPDAFWLGEKIPAELHLPNAAKGMNCH